MRRVYTLLLLAVLACVCGPGLHARDDQVLPPGFLAQEQEALDARWEKHGEKELKAVMPLSEPLPEGEIPSEIAEKCSPKQYRVFRGGTCLFVVVGTRDYERALEGVAPGRLMEIRAEFRRFYTGRRDEMGRAIWKYWLAVSSWRPAVELAPLGDKKDFAPNAYRPLAPRKALENRDYWDGRRAHMQVVFASQKKIDSDTARALGVDAARWRRLEHETAGGWPHLFLPAAALFDWNTLKGMPKGQRLHVYGRVFTLWEGDQAGPGLLVDAASPEAVTEKSPLLNPGETENTSKPNGRRYPHIRKKVLQVTIGGIHDGAFPDYRETGPFVEIALVYRGHGPARPALIEKSPNLKGKSYLAFETAHNDLGDSIAIVCPAGEKSFQKTLSQVEKGDTLVLHCRIGESRDKRYYLEIQDMILPPLQ